MSYLVYLFLFNNIYIVKTLSQYVLSEYKLYVNFNLLWIKSWDEFINKEYNLNVMLKLIFMDKRNSYPFKDLYTTHFKYYYFALFPYFFPSFPTFFRSFPFLLRKAERPSPTQLPSFFLFREPSPAKLLLSLSLNRCRWLPLAAQQPSAPPIRPKQRWNAE